ncbi:MAG: tRNA dihydrouridine synthase DusB [Bacteroidales bacterium]|nr:tRNA dihydrouridine synthase DusB [Bacteroidales bacterium]MBO5719186.1 tRNA dihydrouridine synthase DusB [Bacteroidales bacterium]MBO5818119.1 tRNA dihydrouridine synthase DusB [Bacteroidales bacterium]MBO5915754.1 tRNA dihydrouridine synthase DusB [Bacteroidales bacterium]MBO5977310.1 tRNA dihydrouridine synthase DusB [Bacteroidales bacterium]
MKIATIEFPERSVFLAPMEDVTDPSFRLMCKRFGADMVYTEFVSSDALVRNVNSTMRKLQVSDQERPVAIQIYGKDPQTMAEAARMCEQAHPDIIDINFGCPVKKVAGKGAGAGLLKDIPRMLEITKAVVDAVKVPVTVKTRLGWDMENRNIVDIAEALQDQGIAALTIHGRTRSQMYTGEADWSLIAAVKNNPRMHIPIIGNGDITSAEICRQRFEETGVDAVMIGRASFGRPWIFKEVKHYLQTGEIWDESNAWKLEVLKEQVLQGVQMIKDQRAEKYSEASAEKSGIMHIRRHLAATPLFKGIPNFKETRIAMLRAENLTDLFAIMDTIF